MSTPITEVKFSLYRLDNDETMQSEFILDSDNGGEPDENGVYTFSKVFDPTKNSSFGLNLGTAFEDCFGVKVTALDLAGNPGELNATSNEAEDIENFSMTVRVKESIGPSITLEKDWTHSQSKNFEATYIVQDLSTHNSDVFRPAGIKFDSLKVYIRKGREEFVEQTLAENKYETYFGGQQIADPTPGIDNDSKYKLTYNFEAPEDGLYDIKVVISDNDDNATEFISTINIQSSKPQIAVNPITTPSKDKAVNVITTIKETATIKIEYKEENESESTVVVLENKEAGTYTEVLNLEDGKYTITVYCINQYGVESDRIVQIVEIDSKEPKFLSVKFYPVDRITGTVSSVPATYFDNSQQYKIVVEVE